MSDVTETDLTTNPPTITERSFTAAEIAQRKADVASAKVAATADSERVATIQAARNFALGLGFTEAMIAVTFPALVP